MNEPIEIICGYAVHPAAAMFPLIEGDEFDLLVDSIARNGMHHPIVLRGNQLLDGRNRLRAVEAAREQGYKVSIPTIQWTDDKTSVSEWIWDTNATRRQLTDDGLAMASAAVWPLIASENAERKKASQFTQGESGNVKGRPIGKQTVTTNPSSPVNRDRKASDARSTVGQVGHTVQCDPTPLNPVLEYRIYPPKNLSYCLLHYRPIVLYYRHDTQRQYQRDHHERHRLLPSIDRKTG